MAVAGISIVMAATTKADLKKWANLVFDDDSLSIAFSSSEEGWRQPDAPVLNLLPALFRTTVGVRSAKSSSVARFNRNSRPADGTNGRIGNPTSVARVQT